MSWRKHLAAIDPTPGALHVAVVDADGKLVSMRRVEEPRDVPRAHAELGAGEPCPTHGCSWCGAACPRCTSADALVARVSLTHRAVLDKRPAIHKANAGALHFRLERRQPLSVKEARTLKARPNRHDRRRAACGPYCLTDVPRFSVTVLNRHTADDAGAAWASMCRRVLGVVQSQTVSIELQPSYDASGFRQYAWHLLGARRTQLLRAIADGGWRPDADDPLVATVAAITLRISPWRRRRRRRR